MLIMIAAMIVGRSTLSDIHMDGYIPLLSSDSHHTRSNEVVHEAMIHESSAMLKMPIPGHSPGTSRQIKGREGLGWLIQHNVYAETPFMTIIVGFIIYLMHLLSIYRIYKERRYRLQEQIEIEGIAFDRRHKWRCSQFYFFCVISSVNCFLPSTFCRCIYTGLVVAFSRICFLDKITRNAGTHHA